MMLRPGMAVVDDSGQRIGTVADVDADEATDIFHGIVVSRSGLFSGTVPVQADDVIAVTDDTVTVHAAAVERSVERQSD